LDETPQASSPIRIFNTIRTSKIYYVQCGKILYESVLY
jgi:hypothetical protein